MNIIIKLLNVSQFDFKWALTPLIIFCFYSSSVEAYEGQKWLESRSSGWVTDIRTFLEKESWQESELKTEQGRQAKQYLNEFIKTGKVQKLSLAKQAFIQAAELDDGLANGWLGMLFYTGLGGEKDIKQAIKYLKKGEKLSDTRSLFYIASMYESGLAGFSKDVKKAYTGYQQAAKQDSRLAFYAIARLYENGNEAIGIKKDSIQMFKYLKKSADLGNLYALRELNFQYRVMSNISTLTYKTGKRLCETNTRVGAVGCSSVGKYYYVAKSNYDEAEKWFKRGWEQGEDWSSAADYGIMLYNLIDQKVIPATDANHDKTSLWLERGCAYGEPVKSIHSGDYRAPSPMLIGLACGRIGLMYSEGTHGQTTNFREAEKYYIESQLKENDTYVEQAYIYWPGQLTEKGNNKKIVEIYARGIREAEDARSMVKLGYGYVIGDYDLPKNQEKAYKLFRKAADLGYRTAFMYLGGLYSLVAQDYFENNPSKNEIKINNINCAIYSHIARARLALPLRDHANNMLQGCLSQLNEAEKDFVFNEFQRLNKIYPWLYPESNKEFF